MENLDIFDELFNPLAPTSASIDEVHKKGLWHQTFACWVISPQRKTILFQLRGARNRIDPGSLDASASGHLKAGEKPADGFRELREELGIDIPVENRRWIDAPACLMEIKPLQLYCLGKENLPYIYRASACPGLICTQVERKQEYRFLSSDKLEYSHTFQRM